MAKNRRERQHPEEKPPGEPDRKRFWETAAVRIGVVSGAVGLLVSIVGLPRQIAAAFGGARSAADPELTAEIERSRPILDIRYVLLSADLLGWRASMEMVGEEQGRDVAPERSATARTLLSLPIVQTAAGDETDPLPLSGSDLGHDYQFQQTAFLLIENRGMRDATSITVHAEQLSFETAPRVDESGPGEDDYVDALKRGSSGTARVTIRVPRTLGPGEAVLVPVFVSVSDQGRHDRWWVVSRSALLPDSLSFVDPVIEKRRGAAVRRMVNPTRVERGVMDRG